MFLFSILAAATVTTIVPRTLCSSSEECTKNPTARYVPPSPKLENCKLRGASLVRLEADLPSDLKDVLRSRFKSEMAEVNAEWRNTDSVSIFNAELPTRRFLRAYNYNNKWIIWYEHGGRGYHWHALGVIRTPSSSHANIDPSARYAGFTTKQLCSASQAYFDGADVSSDL